MKASLPRYALAGVYVTDFASLAIVAVPCAGVLTENVTAEEVRDEDRAFKALVAELGLAPK